MKVFQEDAELLPRSRGADSTGTLPAPDPGSDFITFGRESRLVDFSAVWWSGCLSSAPKRTFLEESKDCEMCEVMGTRVGSGREDEWRNAIMATERRPLQSSARNNLLKVNLPPKESRHALPRNLFKFPPFQLERANRAGGS